VMIATSAIHHQYMVTGALRLILRPLNCDFEPAQPRVVEYEERSVSMECS